MHRHILHVDCNKFYASVECCIHPEWRHLPLVVGGSEEARHGIVLTKNEIAAHYDIRTGETLWSARRKCPQLITVPPHFSLYHAFSRKVRRLLLEYTPLVEPFGLDESWMDISHDPRDPVEIAHEIRTRIKEEIGITVSIGVSFNKTFSKLGSDYKKPDAVTIFSRENYRQTVWPLPISSMLYVGHATKEKLKERFLYTIGDVANASPALLCSLLGKNGVDLHAVANGQDNRSVIPLEEADEAQSISNGMTTHRDLTDNRDIRQVITLLAESVGRRLREQHLCGHIVELHLRDNRLVTHTHRVTLDHYIQATDNVAQEAYALFCSAYRWQHPLRSVTVGVSGLESENVPFQLDMTDSSEREKRQQLDKIVDGLRQRFGDTCIRRAVLLEDLALTEGHRLDQQAVDIPLFGRK